VPADIDDGFHYACVSRGAARKVMGPGSRYLYTYRSMKSLASILDQVQQLTPASISSHPRQPARQSVLVTRSSLGNQRNPSQHFLC
jgi:hypothetical protein